MTYAQVSMTVRFVNGLPSFSVREGDGAVSKTMETDVRGWKGRRTELVAKLTRNDAFNLRVLIQFRRNECERKRW
jgi:hypothetical protein